MTNDASPRDISADEPARNADPERDDWESTALKRVAAQHRELHGAGQERARRSTDWERRAVECLKRYFRAQG